MQTKECFEAAIGIENLLRDVYDGLAERYAAEPEMSELFHDLAREEEQHANRIGLLARHYQDGVWTREVSARITTQLAGMAADLLSMAAELNREGSGETARDVLWRVIEAEYRCESLHAEVLAQTAEIDVQILFTSLAKQDRRHEELLALSSRSTGRRLLERRPPPLPRMVS